MYDLRIYTNDWIAEFKEAILKGCPVDANSFECRAFYLLQEWVSEMQRIIDFPTYFKKLKREVKEND